VGRINALAGLDSVQASTELIALIRLGLHYGGMSNGAFDIAIKPVVKAWDFLAPTPHVPSNEKIQALLSLVDDGQVSIAGGKVYLPHKGMGIDLGAYGKGYAIDRAVQVLRRAGYRQLIVDIGGKLGIYWEGTRMLDSTAADVSIRHPRRGGDYLGSFRMGTGAVSTSGDYERFFVENGVRYHHLLDPATGYPMRGIVSVTLVATDAVWADALSTMVFLLGRDKGMELMKQSPGVDGMIVYESADTLAFDFTSGFRRRFIAAESHD
jgi:thiamine biosynthesis lipoprotein